MTRSLDALTPDTRAAIELLLEHAAGLGMDIQINETRRTCARQNQLFAQGRETEGKILTGARGCRSWHVHGRAVDLITKGPQSIPPYRALGDFWKGLGGKWGGDFKGLDDYGHFEWHPGFGITDVCLDVDGCVVQEHAPVYPQLPGRGGSGIGWVLAAGLAGTAAYLVLRGRRG